jgi:hypothetical protein
MFIIFGVTPTYNLKQIVFIRWSKTAQMKKRYAQGFSAFDTAETAADSKRGV